MSNAQSERQISPELCRIYGFVKAAERWVTSREIAERAEVSGRTARAHALSLTEAGVFERAEVWPGNRYRLAPVGNPLAEDIERVTRIIAAE